jgi:hypothetical protein
MEKSVVQVSASAGCLHVSGHLPSRVSYHAFFFIVNILDKASAIAVLYLNAVTMCTMNIFPYFTTCVPRDTGTGDPARLPAQVAG